jgi:predicted dehydrogenase
MVAVPNASRLRLGFLGLGWIGRHRMQAVLDSGVAAAVAVSDPDHGCRDEALTLAPDAVCCDDLDALLAQSLDGVVIATPSAAHAAQSIRVLERGVPVFCQKPLGRDRHEVTAVIEAARRVDRLLGVDLSYRHLAGMAAAHRLLQQGALGRVYGVQAVFHNAYGPDKPWFYRRESAGGGCVIDLGVHLIDLALWLLGRPAVEGVRGRCFAGGRPLHEVPTEVEDYATAQIDLASGIVMDMACSWNLPIGVDAEIGLRVYGSEGSIVLRNVGGSFYDFVLEYFRGSQREVLGEPPDPWGGRALVAWARQLAGSNGYDPAVDDLANVAAVIDRIYAQEGAAH